MSTILKALKKLEERKAAEGQRSGDIAWDILREDDPRTDLEARWKIWAGIVAGLACLTILLSWVLFLQAGPEEKVSRTDPGLNLVEPVDAARRTTPQRQPENAKLPLPEPAAPVMRSSELTPVPADLSLSVSGIAFQENADARMAIVNDLPVMVGTVIEGVVVEQIDEQRVLFSRRGKRFAVPITTPE